MDFSETFFPRQYKLYINKKEYPPLKLGKFFILRRLREQFTEALHAKNKKNLKIFADKILMLYDIERNSSHTLADILVTIHQIFNINHLDADVVFLTPPPKEKGKAPEKKERWEHEDRAFVQWIHIFAKTYGWSIDDILNLDINAAAYLYQEILVNEHYDKEWEYSLTELAYHTDKNSNKSRYVPLTKPYWMRQDIEGKIQKTKIRKDMLPMGVIVDLGGFGDLRNDIQEEENSTTSS